MDIIVCIKQVPDTTNIKIDQKKGTLIREGVPSIMNPDDKHALEAALSLKGDGKITVLSMGPPQAEDALREALAMGADESILLCDIKFAGSDTWATANAIAAAIKKIGKYDLILCGRQAIDGDTAQVGPQMAEQLNLPQVTYVRKIGAKGNKLVIERVLEDGYEIVEANLPALLTCVKEINAPRYPSLLGIQKAYREKEVKTWTAADINIDGSRTGLKSSPTSVFKSFTPQPKGSGVILEGPISDVSKKIIGILKEKEIIQEF
ncbi:electron transfer flavoprotein subunit beta/FixA family protein [Candidatus Woesearchaeota archaeon]|nr:electron transfer flavoprotein subunit beta/FixA family protein [Candidatus Woesearchaeota archaeon]